MSGISKSQVSRLCGERRQDRPLEGDWPYLWLDALCEGAPDRTHRLGRSVAVAVNDQGRREVLGVAIGGRRPRPSTEFLRSLARRGFVISDEGRRPGSSAPSAAACTSPATCWPMPARSWLAQEDADSAKAPPSPTSSGQGWPFSWTKPSTIHELPQGAPPEIALHKPDRTAPCRGQAPHQRRRYLSQRSRHHTASPSFSSRTTVGRLKEIHDAGIHPPLGDGVITLPTVAADVPALPAGSRVQRSYTTRRHDQQ